MWSNIKNFFAQLWSDISEFFLDLFATILGLVLDLIVFILGLIPIPSFMEGFTPSDYIPDSIGYFLDMSNFPEAMAIIGAGILFRLTRKLLTLGAW